MIDRLLALPRMSIFWFSVDQVLLLLPQVGQFLGALWLFRNHILRDYDVNNSKVQLIFCLMFTLSCTMFVLIAAEIVGIFDDGFRWFHWHATVYLLLLLLLIIIPFYELYSITASLGFARPRTLLISSLLLCVFFYLLKYIDNPLATQQYGFFSVEMGVTRVSTIGVTLIAFLAGYGAVNAVYSNLSFFLSNVTDDELHSLEVHLVKTIDRVFEKKKKLFLMMEEKQRRGTDSPSKWGSVVSFFTRADAGVDTLQGEVESLEEFARELFLEVNEQRANRARAEWARTVWGRLMNLWAVAFSLYCSYKILTAAANIIFSRTPGTDPVTRTLAIALHLFRIEIDARFWSQTISFVFVGVIMVTSLRGFMLQLMKIVNRYTSTISYNTVVLFLTHLMGMYFLSSVLLLRLSLPVAYRGMITMVLGDIEFHFYHRWFDYIFLPSCICTIVFFFVQHKTSRSRGSVIDY